MRPTEFTNQQVIEAGQALLAEGRKVSGFALAQKVGGGRPARLKQVWDEHVVGQGVVEAEPVSALPVEVADVLQSLSASLVERVHNLALELNDKAVRTAEGRVAEVVRAAADQRAQAEQEIVDATATVDDLTDKLDLADAENVRLAQALETEQGKRQALEVEAAGLKEKLANAEQATSKAVAQVADLQAEIKRLSEQAQASREQAMKAEGKVEAVAVSLKASEERVVQLQARVETVEGDRDSARQEAAATKAELAGATESLSALGRERDTARADLVGSRDEAKTARAELGTAHSEIQRLKGEIQRLQGELIAKPAAKAPKA